MLPVPAISPPLGAPGRGAGWELRCPLCGNSGETLPGGLCSACGVAVAPTGIATLADRLPGPAVRVLGRLGPYLSRLAPWPTQSPWSFALFWIALGLGFHPLSSGFLALVGWGVLIDRRFPAPHGTGGPPRRIREPMPPGTPLPSGATPRPRLTWVHSPRLALTRSRADLTRLRDRRGLRVQVDLEISGIQGDALDLELRVRGPDRRYLAARLPRYRGAAGEALARHRTRRLRLDDSRFPDLWIWVPLAALGLPAGLLRAELEAEVRILCRGALLLEHRLPVDFLPVPGDLTHSPPREDGRAPGLLLGSLEEAAHPPCGVCGDPVVLEPGDPDPGAGSLRCPDCGTAHHRECRDYLGGCSRFGCPAGPSPLGEPPRPAA